MPVLAGAADLAAICACLMYLALLVTASWLVGVLLGFTNISVLGKHPLKNIATGALNAINKGLADQIVATEDVVSILWSGFTWLIREGGNAIGALAGSTYGTFSYLWRTGIPAAIHAVTAPISDLAQRAYNEASSAGSTATAAGASVKTEVANAIKTAENYTDSQITIAHKYVETQVASGVASAGITAGQLVAQAISLTTKDYNELKGDFDSVPAEIKAQIANLPASINLRDVANEITKELAPGQSIYNEISQRIAGIGGGVTAQDITNAINEALAPGQSIYNKIESLIPTIPGGLTIADVTAAISASLAPGEDIYKAIHDAVDSASGGLTAADITAAIATALLPGQPIEAAIDAAIGAISIPVPPGGIPIPTPTIAQLTTGLAAVTTGLAVLEAEAGLDSEACRAKNKQICGTDAAAWTKLLEGAALIALDFNFTELVNACTAILPTVESAVTSFE